MIRRNITICILLATLTTLAIGSLTPVFKNVQSYLPPYTDIFLHFVAHTILSIAAYQLVSSTTPPSVICAASITLAVLIELLQTLIKDRSAQLADLAAATVASFVVFFIPKDGRYFRPSLAALASYLSPDDDDDEDEHRVGSWAV